MSRMPPDSENTREAQREFFDDLARAEDEYEAEAETNR